MSESPVLITGANGFIGRHLVHRLGELGQGLRLLDRNFDPSFGSRYEIIEGSVGDFATVERAIAGCAKVVHLAHLMDIDGNRPFDSIAVNIGGTANLFRAAQEAGVSRVVWASSVMTYGPQMVPGRASESAIQAPATFYGAGKLYLEQLGLACRRMGLETVGLRLTTVFGPGRDRGGAAPFCVELFREPAAGRPVTIREGDRRLDLVYVPDAVEAIALALGAAPGLAHAYNIGGFTARVSEIADAVRRNLPDAEITVNGGGSNPWPEEIDCSAAWADFGYRATYDLARATSDYITALCGPLSASREANNLSEKS